MIWTVNITVRAFLAHLSSIYLMTNNDKEV